VGGGLAMMLVDAFTPKGADRSELATLSTVILLVAAGLAVGVWIAGPPQHVPAVVSAYLATDQLALFFDVVICAGTAFATLLAGGYLREHELDRGEFYPLILFSAFGAMVLARATDLL